MEEKLIDIITIGVIIYTCIMIISLYEKHDNVLKDLKKRYNESKLEVNIGIILFIVIIITNIYYRINYEKLDKDLELKTRRLYEATVSGIIALLIAVMVEARGMLRGTEANGDQLLRQQPKLDQVPPLGEERGP